MSYLLDSDVVIDFLKQKDPGFSLVSKIIEEKLYISIVSWVEILYGIKKAKLVPKRSTQFNDFLQELNIEIIPINQEIGTLFVDLKINLENKGEKLADFDILIASTTKAYKLMLVTRNLKHFNRVPGLKILKG